MACLQLIDIGKELFPLSSPSSTHSFYCYLADVLQVIGIGKECSLLSPHTHTHTHTHAHTHTFGYLDDYVTGDRYRQGAGSDGKAAERTEHNRHGAAEGHVPL